MPKYRRIEVGTYEIPDEAVTLIEDVQTLELILKLLETIRERSVIPSGFNHDKNKTETQRMLRRVGFLIASMHGIAQDNLRYDYLGGKPIRPKAKRQTLADVWQIILNESKGDLSK